MLNFYYERCRRPSEFSLNMIIFSSWATRPTDRPTDRDAFQRLISFEPSYRLTNGFRHLKATFNKSFVLTLAPLGGGGAKGPLWFFANSSWSTGISHWNMPYLSGQQFHTLCQKIRTQFIIGQPWVTSEWRHVSPILTNKMGFRESPPLVQF